MGSHFYIGVSSDILAGCRVALLPPVDFIPLREFYRLLTKVLLLWWPPWNLPGLNSSQWVFPLGMVLLFPKIRGLTSGVRSAKGAKFLSSRLFVFPNLVFDPLPFLGGVITRAFFKGLGPSFAHNWPRFGPLPQTRGF